MTNLFDDGADVGQTVLVLGAGPVVSSNYAVQLLVSTALYFRMRREKREKPLDNASGLQD